MQQRIPSDDEVPQIHRSVVGVCMEDEMRNFGLNDIRFGRAGASIPPSDRQDRPRKGRSGGRSLEVVVTAVLGIVLAAAFMLAVLH